MRGTFPGRICLNLALFGCRIAGVAALVLCARNSEAQRLQQRGYAELSFTGFPNTAPGDSGRAIGESVLHYHAALRIKPFLVLQGVVVARSDTHRQVEREAHVSYWDRSIRRPALDVQQLSGRYFRGPLTLELGKQMIRWGKTDILNPTDRFAPRDYLVLTESEYLGITAARLTIGRGGKSLDIVCAPRFTPSRIPLLDQRWTVRPAALSGIPLEAAGASYPGGAQLGARWSQTAAAFEYSLSMFHGFNHLPDINIDWQASPARITVSRIYPKIRSYGGDFAASLKWFLAKAEAAWIQDLAPNSNDYLLYVVQAERHYREWLFIGGYAGEHIGAGPQRLHFDPDRGLAKSIVARAALTVSATQNLLFELVARQNAKGFYSKLEYSRSFGDHLRATVRFVLLRGTESDFIGQYRGNSFGSFTTRYSF